MALDPGGFLQEAASRPFRWGREDCILLLCDWIETQKGIDPGKPYRGRYSTALGAQRLIRRSGGLIALLDLAFATAGVSRADNPQAGDVGVVLGDLGGREGPCGAIYTGQRWAGLSITGGLFVGPAEAQAVWRV